MRRLLGMFTSLYLFITVVIAISLGFEWSSLSLLLASGFALSAGAGLKASFYQGTPILGIFGSFVILSISLLIVKSTGNIEITLGDISLTGEIWIVTGALGFLILTPKELTINVDHVD